MLKTQDAEALIDERVTGVFSKQQIQRYWTPDGREVRSAPSWHEYVRKDKNGKVVESGVRDANLDKGWLLQPPLEPKLYCEYCDKWHDTEEEIEKCGQRKKSFDAKHLELAKKEIEKSEEGRLDKLESEMSEIKGMLKQLLER